MKYRAWLLFVLLLLVFASALPLLRTYSGKASEARGENQFSFSQSDTGVYSLGSMRDNESSATAVPSAKPSVQALHDSKTALQNGQSAGQVSNVPGTTSTSPNGTSNFWGTGGEPVFPEDLGHQK